MERKTKADVKAWEENRLREDAPEICKSCGHYLPMFFKVINKECAVFTTTDGVRNDACGAWTRRIANGAQSRKQ